MALKYNAVPAEATLVPDPFLVNIPDEQVEELQLLLKLSKIAPPTFESLQKDRKYGVTTEWLTTATDAWKEFDWRSAEKHINSFPQFTYRIEDLDIHFVALFSERDDAIPILFIHGCFIEFLPMLSHFREKYTPATLPYHLVVPSLPGYTFSSGPPVDREFGTEDVARVLNQVMVGLGFASGYVAQGGDIGSKIARIIGVDYESCKAVHSNACLMMKPPNIPEDLEISDLEKRGLERAAWFATWGMGYYFEHGSRPSTIGNAIATNPVSLLTWIGEKFLDWVDEPLPLDTILESVSLYWFTGTFPRSIYFYREIFPPQKAAHAMEPRWYIQKPFGFSYFPMELNAVPRAWVETTGNLRFWKFHEKGGHFAALERPEELAEDVESFCAILPKW